MSAAPAPLSIPRPKLRAISMAVAENLGIDTRVIRGRGRTKRVALARQLYCYLARKLTKHSYLEIAIECGCRDHSTVVHAVKRIEVRRSVEPEVEAAIREITANLREAAIPMAVGPALVVNARKQIVSANAEFIELLAEAISRKMQAQTETVPKITSTDPEEISI